MNNKTKYTVAEYARLMGVSKQAIYKQRNGKLKGRYITVNGKAYIITDNNQPPTQEQPTTNQNLNQPTNQPLNQPTQDLPLWGNTEQPSTQEQPTANQNLNPETNQSNQDFIQFLLKQIEIKDKQIDELQKHNNLLANSIIQDNILQAHDKGITPLLENNNNENTKSKKHRGIFGIFKRKRI